MSLSSGAQKASYAIVYFKMVLVLRRRGGESKEIVEEN
jgi:hypothetical protein